MEQSSNYRDLYFIFFAVKKISGWMLAWIENKDLKSPAFYSSLCFK